MQKAEYRYYEISWDIPVLSYRGKVGNYLRDRQYAFS